MVRRKKLIAYAIVLALAIIVIYGCSFTYSVEPFFSIPLSHPEAPIDELCGVIWHPIRCIHSLTPVALDAKGRIYILGLKKGRSKVLVLNREGKIERTITPYLKNNHPLGRRSPFLSVSPSGNFIWTVKEEGIDVYRVTVHDRNGEAKMEWLVRDCDVEHHIAFNAYSEDGAYLVSNVIEIICFRLGRKEPQRIKLSENFHPPYPIFFHKGKYWGITEMKWLIPKMEHLKFKGQIEMSEIGEDSHGIVTWSPKEGMRLLSVIRLPIAGAILQWIDERGNFYDTRYGHTSLYDSLPSWAKEGIWGERIVKILKALRLYDRFRKLKQGVTVRIFSPRGELKEVIRLWHVIRPKRGEKLEYGALVKVDDKGIYWEVGKVNEPREYRIVRIVKKRRWQVWWDALCSWFNPVQPKGKVTY
ncbi:hypothetical protein B0813_001902 [Candidatus Fervidibacteria bacterium JGI MDM2 SSWTFF-3-K9]